MLLTAIHRRVVLVLYPEFQGPLCLSLCFFLFSEMQWFGYELTVLPDWFMGWKTDFQCGGVVVVGPVRGEAF